jgi:DNA (cytosine-5)-methyltransferase 1
MHGITHGSLFSGIGGIDLGFERVGIRTVWQVENEPFCQAILAKHWPEVARYSDIKQCHNLPYADIISGGFPCQDISNAGKRKGISGSRSGLWKEFARIIGETMPRYVVAENVAALVNRGLEEVLQDLAKMGYNAQWGIVSASDVGTCHKRQRIFIIANRDGIGQQLECQNTKEGCEGITFQKNRGVPLPRVLFANYRSKRIQRFREEQVSPLKAFSWCKDVRRVEDLRQRPDIPESLICGDCNGIPNRVDRTKSLGNAVVPQVAEFIGEFMLKLAGDTHG